MESSRSRLPNFMSCQAHSGLRGLAVWTSARISVQWRHSINHDSCLVYQKHAFIVCFIVFILPCFVSFFIKHNTKNTLLCFYRFCLTRDHPGPTVFYRCCLPPKRHLFSRRPFFIVFVCPPRNRRFIVFVCPHAPGANKHDSNKMKNSGVKQNDINKNASNVFLVN